MPSDLEYQRIRVRRLNLALLECNPVRKMTRQPIDAAASLDRRGFLHRTGGGFGTVALAYLLGSESLLADSTTGKLLGPKPELNGGLHYSARAKRVVQLFMSGAASQCDTFDYKPILNRKNGQKFDPGGKVELFQSEPGAIMASPWKWRQYGDCGRWISDLVPHLATCVDDIAFLPAMVAKSNVHGPATFMQSTGFVLPGFPERGRLDLLWHGKSQPEPADICGAARLARIRPQRTGELECGLPAGRAPGDDGPPRCQEPDLRPVPA